MIRKIAIGLAAAVIATGGLTLSASAYRGGAGHSGGYSKGGMGKVGMNRGGTYRTGRTGPRSYGMYRPDRYGHHDHWRWRHRPGYNYYSYSGGGSCWRNVWTPGGWTRQWVCGHGRPYGYGGGYYRQWHGPRYGHWGGGRRPVYGRR
jgi:hypothetical protein